MGRLLEIHWGFLVGGGGRYAQIIEQLGSGQTFDVFNLCILDSRWATDADGLSHLRHKKIPIRGRLDRSWIAPVCAELCARNPTLVMTHGFNAHFVAWRCQQRLRYRLPVVCSYHGPYHPVNLKGRFLGPIYDQFTGWFLRQHALGVVTVAHHAKMSLVQAGVPEKKIRVIHNGVETAHDTSEDLRHRAAYREKWGVLPDEFLIGSIGRLDPVKGFRYLIDAFARLEPRLQRLRMVIVGDGPQRLALEKLALTCHGREAINFTGPMPGASAALPAFDLFALPSLSECHSMALLEAMRAGLPIVATNVGGNPESITHEVEGLLVPPADPAALAAGIDRLLQNRSWANELGRAAQSRFQREFTEDIMLRKTANWLFDCAELARSRG